MEGYSQINAKCPSIFGFHCLCQFLFQARFPSVPSCALFHERHRVLLVLCVGFFLACAPLCDFEIVWRRLCPMCTISQSFICYWWQLRCVTSMEYAACTSRQFSVWCSFIMSTKYCKTGCLLNSFSSVLELHYTAVVHQI